MGFLFTIQRALALLVCALSVARAVESLADEEGKVSYSSSRGLANVVQEIVADVVEAKGDLWGTLGSKLLGEQQKATPTPAPSASVPSTTALRSSTALPQTTPPSTTATPLVAVNFLTRITTFVPANFTAGPQAEYIQGILDSAPNIFRVIINSIVEGSVIVNTTAVTTQEDVPAVVDATSTGFNETLPEETFGEPTVTDVSVTPVTAADIATSVPTATTASPVATTSPSGSTRAPPGSTPPPPTSASNAFTTPPPTTNASNETSAAGPAV